MQLQLEYVHLVHRHGERTPLMFGPYDNTRWNMCHRASKILYTIPKRNLSISDRIKGFLSYVHIGPGLPLYFKITQNSGYDFNCAPGQLTDTGRANLFGLGEWFRNKYVEKEQLIKPSFDKEQFHLRSTNFQRTLESLQSLMQGIFRDYAGPMDVKVVDLSQDTLTSNRYCPRLKMLKELSHQNLKKAFEPQAAEIRKYFTKNHSSFFASLGPYAIYDLVASSRAHGFTQFMKVPRKILQSLEKHAVDLWFAHLHTPEGLSLRTGAVMKEIADGMLNKVTDPSATVKASIFSGHDTTIYPILLAVGDTAHRNWPKFGANIIFELFKEEGSEERYVQMRYNRNAIPMPRCNPVKIGGGSFCKLEEFVKMCNKIYIENYETACVKS